MIFDEPVYDQGVLQQTSCDVIKCPSPKGGEISTAAPWAHSTAGKAQRCARDTRQIHCENPREIPYKDLLGCAFVTDTFKATFPTCLFHQNSYSRDSMNSLGLADVEDQLTREIAKECRS